MNRADVETPDVEKWYPVVRYLARRAAAIMSVDPDEMLSAAHLGLARAVKTFSPGKATWNTYATLVVQREVSRAALRERGKVWRRHEVMSSIESMAHELQREPSLQELCAARPDLRASVHRMLELDNPYRLDAAAQFDERPVRELATVVDFDGAIAARELREAIATLNPRLRAIVEATYFEGWSQTEVARDLGISPQRAQQLVQRALRQLRATLERRSPDRRSA